VKRWPDAILLIRAPYRGGVLTPWDAAGGFGLMVAGVLVAQAALALFVPMANNAYRYEAATQEAVAMVGQQLLTFGLPVVFLITRARATPGGVRRLGLVPRNWLAALWRGALATAAIVTGVFAFMFVLGLLWQWAHGPTDPLAHKLLQKIIEAGPLPKALMLLGALVIAPVMEELLFRGLIQTAAQESLRWQPGLRWAGVAITAVLFAGIHVGVQPEGTPLVLILAPLLLLGLALGWVYEATGNIVAPIMVHIGFNTLNVSWAIWVLPALT